MKAGRQLQERLEKKILYKLALDPSARQLAEKVLDRFKRLVGRLPASAEHHHSEAWGLYRHSLEVALNALEEFEGNMIMERRPDGSVDSFRSARNRPRWQYATFLSALAHDVGKLFDIEVRSGERRWVPFTELYDDFARRHRTGTVTWRADRQHGTHAVLSCLLLTPCSLACCFTTCCRLKTSTTWG